VLDTLTPGERVAFVLHDMFNLPFEEVARILDRTPIAVRQLASRARRRVQGTEAPAADITLHRELVGAFLAASREGDFERLVAVLSPEVVLRADEGAVRAAAARQSQGAPQLAPEIRGAARVANTFKGRARAAVPAMIDGEPGAVWAVGGRVMSAFIFTIEDRSITGIDIVVDPAVLAELEVRID
jgi:RNA polymerase sigma-70 factor (ECF subfamily)